MKPLATKTSLVHAGVCAALSLVSTQVLSQTTGPQAASGKLEEVIVTANRREENLQSVAAAISVLDGETLALRGSDRLEDYIGTQPGITLFQPLQNRATVTIRGINTDIGDTQLTQEPTALYIDEMHVMPPYGALVLPDVRMLDIDRVEFLRGPQGTLYGSGSLAGAVRVITKKPNMSEFEGEIRADVADVDRAGTRQRYGGVLNVPLIEDELALRGAVYLRDEPGWVRNVTQGTRNSNDDWGGRLALRWTPSDTFKMDLTYLQQRSSPEDGDAWNPDLGKFQRDSVVNEGRQADLNQASVNLEWDLGAVTITSITNYQATDTGWVIQGADSPPFGTLVNVSEPADSKIINQEFRFNGEFGSISWVAGAFAQQVDLFLPVDVQFTNLADFVNSIGGSLDSNSLVVELTDTTATEEAIFGDVSWAINDQWTLAAGLRGFRTESEFATRGTYLFDFDTLSPVNLPPISNKADDDAVTWRVNLAWQATDNHMLYANAATGYRVGQVNPNFGPSFVDPNDIVIAESYERDETLNLELGFRTQWLEDRLSINGAIFHIDWTDVQTDALRPSDGRNFIANAGDAISQGLELEIGATVTDNLQMTAALAWVDAEIDSISAQNSLLSGAVEGDVMPGAADFTATVALDYFGASGISGWNLEAGLLMTHRADSPNRFTNEPGSGLPNPSYDINESYTAFDGRVGLSNGDWQVTAYGENLANDDSIILYTGALATGDGRNTAITLTPRTFGLRVVRNF